MSKLSSKRDVSVVFDLHRVLRKRFPKAMLFSIFAVALLLIGPLSLVIAGIGESSADNGYVGNKITITYHPYEEGKEPTITSNYNSSGEYGSISVTYYGDFASTEYNPQLWSSDVADGGSSALYGAVLEHGVNLKKWYPIKSYNKGKTIVFTGWVYSSGNVKKEYDPGDIVNIGECTDGKIDRYATWGELKNHTNVLKTANKWKDGTVYTNIFEFDSIELTENTFFNNNNNNKTIGPNYTLRGKTSDSTIDLGDKNVKGYINISGKTIIDNCIIKGTKGDNNHGEGDTGIFANGNKLIMGSNVKGTPNGSTEANYAQIFGGSKTGASFSFTVSVIDGFKFDLKDMKAITSAGRELTKTMNADGTYSFKLESVDSNTTILLTGYKQYFRIITVFDDVESKEKYEEWSPEGSILSLPLSSTTGGDVRATVYMNGADITGNSYSNGKVYIPSLQGDVMIFAYSVDKTGMMVWVFIALGAIAVAGVLGFMLYRRRHSV